MNCPDCKHPVNRHDEFFCMQTGCKCNFGRATALARAERDIARKQLEVAKKAMDYVLKTYDINGKPSNKLAVEMCDIVEDAFVEINNIGVANA
jgi:hypothetical protein